MKNIQINKQRNLVYTGLAIDIDVTIGSNFYNRSIYNIRGIYNTITKKAELSIVGLSYPLEIDSHRYTMSEKQDLSIFCKKNGYDYEEMLDYIINNFKNKQ